MLSRRIFLTGAATAGLAIGTQPIPAAAKVNGRLIVDSQNHIWLPNTPERPWISKDAKAQMPDAFTLERLVPIMDSEGVDRVILVTPSWAGAKYGNEYLAEAPKQYPGRFGIIGIGIMLDKPEQEPLVTAWRDQPGFLGIRVDMTRAALTSGSADWFWSAAQKADVPLCFIASGLNSLIGNIAERFPALPLIVDHMGVSSAFKAANPNTWQEEIKVVVRLAKYQNVSVKLSSIPFYSSQPYPWRDTFPYIQSCFDAFGPLRCHWGTDQTHTFEKATYKQRITQFTEELPFLSENDKDWVMGRSLLARLRWP